MPAGRTKAYCGWRIVTFKDGTTVRLISRKGVDHTARFLEVAGAVVKLQRPA